MDKNILKRSILVIGLVALTIAVFAITGCKDCPDGEDCSESEPCPPRNPCKEVVGGQVVCKDKCDEGGSSGGDENGCPPCDCKTGYQPCPDGRKCCASGQSCRIGKCSSGGDMNFCIYAPDDLTVTYTCINDCPDGSPACPDASKCCNEDEVCIVEGITYSCKNKAGQCDTEKTPCPKYPSCCDQGDSCLQLGSDSVCCDNSKKVCIYGGPQTYVSLNSCTSVSDCPTDGEDRACSTECDYWADLYSRPS